MSEMETLESAEGRLQCAVCGLQGVRAAATSTSLEEADIPDCISSIFVKPILTELFPTGFGGKPFEYLLAKKFFLPFCNDCEAQVHGVLSAKTEIENLRRLIDAHLNCIRIKIKERMEEDNYPDEESKVLGQHILGIQKAKDRKSKEDSTEGSAAEDPSPSSNRASKRASVRREVSETLDGTSNIAEEVDEASPRKSTRTRSVKKPARYDDATAGKTFASPRKIENEAVSDLEQVDLNDHSDLIGFTVVADASDLTALDPDWQEPSPTKSSKQEKRTNKSKRGRPRGTSKKAAKVIKQVQAPKVFSEEVEPGVYKYKDHVFRRRPDQKWECDTCHSVMKDRHNCLVHITNIHMGRGKGVFECNICGKIYDRGSTLKIHQEIHRGKSFMCQWCGKLFAQRGNLKQHVQTHEGELNQVCDFEGCGKRFLLPKQLRLHRMRHENDRPYLCEHCPKRYLLQAELDNHLRTHTGERPYACNICPSTFFIKGRLARHYKKVHRISPETFRVNAVLPAESVPVAYVLTEV